MDEKRHEKEQKHLPRRGRGGGRQGQRSRGKAEQNGQREQDNTPEKAPSIFCRPTSFGKSKARKASLFQDKAVRKYKSHCDDCGEQVQQEQKGTVGGEEGVKVCPSTAVKEGLPHLRQVHDQQKTQNNHRRVAREPLPRRGCQHACFLKGRYPHDHLLHRVARYPFIIAYFSALDKPLGAISMEEFRRQNCADFTKFTLGI